MTLFGTPYDLHGNNCQPKIDLGPVFPGSIQADLYTSPTILTISSVGDDLGVHQ